MSVFSVSQEARSWLRMRMGKEMRRLEEREGLEQSSRRVGGWPDGEEVTWSPGSTKGSYEAQSHGLTGTPVSRVVCCPQPCSATQM